MDRFGVLPPKAAFYYERKAKGGAACVIVGECNVDSKFGTGSAYAVRLDDPFLQVRLNTEVMPEYAKSVNADVLIATDTRHRQR